MCSKLCGPDLEYVTDRRWVDVPIGIAGLQFQLFRVDVSRVTRGEGAPGERNGSNTAMVFTVTRRLAPRLPSFMFIKVK